MDTFFNGILSDPVKLAVVGCGCSVATEPVAEISYHWNISQVYYSGPGIIILLLNVYTIITVDCIQCTSYFQLL